MANLEHYEAFVETLRRGSMTAAAGHLRRSPQAISRAIAVLEDELGVELVRRTTRRLHATRAGEALFERLTSALREIEEARAEAQRETARVRGLFRIASSVLFAPRFIVPAATAFLHRFPEVEVEMVLSDKRADLVAERLDVAIRIGDPGPPTHRFRTVAQLRRVVVAAPDYLSRHGRPRTPADRVSHLCVVRTFGPEGDAWPLTEQRKVTRVPVEGRFRCNDAATANAAVLQGAGIGLAPLWQVRQEIDDGRLEVLLDGHEPPPIPVNAVWPGGVRAPVRTRHFVDMLAHRLAGERI